jgi:phosphohistidine phosphatase SixA
VAASAKVQCSSSSHAAQLRKLFLVRHGSAGDRAAWEGDDRARPLDERGLRQAEALVELLKPYEVERILSSPALRCVQTAEPLAKARGLRLELMDDLTEELQATAGAGLVRSVAGTATVVCGHGGLEYALPDPPRWKKGAVLVVGDGLEVIETLRPKL